jgi:toxin ParE1/3/4
MLLRFTAEAERDLEAISDWIAESNPHRAISFLVELRDACRILMEFPESCPLVPRYESRGIRRKVSGSYLIFYVVDANSVTIIHVLHGARDIDLWLLE